MAEFATDDLERADQQRERKRVRVGLIGLGMILVVGAVVAVFIAEREADREMTIWETRLKLVAEGRGDAVGEWLDDQRNVVGQLAQNTSLQLYLTNILSDPEAASASGQRGYLANLLATTAQRTGFFQATATSEVRANVDSDGSAGLFLLSADGQVISKSPAAPSLSAVGFTADDLTPGIRGDLRLDNGIPLLAFISPVVAVQEDQGVSAPIGYVVGARPLGPELAARLRQPGDVTRSARTVLLATAGPRGPVALSTMDGAGIQIGDRLGDPLTERAIAAPGRMVRGLGPSGDRLLGYGVRVDGSPGWMVLRVVAAQEVLGPVRQQRLVIIGGLVLLSALVAVTIGLVWRHGASVRVAEAAAKQAVLLRRFKRLSEFLTTVTDGQPTSIIAINRKREIRFANKRAAADVKMSAADLLGRTVAAVYPAEPARIIEEGCDALQQQGGVVVRTDEETEDGDRKVFISSFLPLSETKEQDASILVVRENVTPLVAAQERKRDVLARLVETLTTLIDARDPYSAGHSRRVAEVASALAEQMDVEPSLREAVRAAGLLLNLGKIFVPKDLLVKEGALTDDELVQVRTAMAKSSDLLGQVDFDGPVAQTLDQVQERWDGTGRPAGLKGEQILQSARILAVANAFVAMVSARAHREGLSLDAVADALMKDAGKAFDRAVVAALVHLLDSGGAKERWAAFATPPKVAHVEKIQ